jgi:glyoxylase-like metal-dependent hydrolase (beta-lactamase superfamily II)
MKLAKLSLWLGMTCCGMALLAACSSKTPEQQMVNDVAKALGGVERVQAVTALVLEGTGSQYNFGQDVRPGAREETFKVTGYHRAVDLAGGRSRTELTRVANFIYSQGPGPQKLVQGIVGNVAWNINAAGVVSRAADPVAIERHAELYHHPLAAVRAALDPAAKLGNLRRQGDDSLLDVVAADGQKFTLAVHAITMLPSRVITESDHINLGDVANSTSFEDYKESGGLRLPTKFTTRTDDFAIAEFQIASHGVNADTGDLAVPAEAASAPAVPGQLPANVTVESLAKGVWLLAGQTHHSVLVEFKDHGVLIEAPQNDTRTLAVIERARALLKGKPVTMVVATHHHFDHAGGLRAAIAEGLTVITHAGNIATFERVADRPHTRSPDHLARNPKPAAFEGVTTDKLMSDGTMTLQLLAAPGPHSETMLVAWLPGSRMLVEADLYTPGGTNPPVFAPTLLQQLETLGLPVDRIVPLHGTEVTVPFSRFRKEALAAASGPG